jgi:hypothetical protein
VASQRQIDANRRNAQKSTGPRTLQGKTVSRFNALQTGIDAVCTVIPGESPAGLERLTREYYHRWQPTLPGERALVDSLIHDDWQLRRLRRAEAQLWQQVEQDYSIWDGRKTKSHMGATVERGATPFSRLQWRYDATVRSFRRNLELLQSMSHSAAEAPGPEAPLLEAAPAAVEFPSNALPQPEAISVTPAPSTPPREIGFVPEPTLAGDPAQPEWGQPESPVTIGPEERVANSGQGGIGSVPLRSRRIHMQ